MFIGKYKSDDQTFFVQQVERLNYGALKSLMFRISESLEFQTSADTCHHTGLLSMVLSPLEQA